MTLLNYQSGTPMSALTGPLVSLMLTVGHVISRPPAKTIMPNSNPKALNHHMPTKPGTASGHKAQATPKCSHGTQLLHALFNLLGGLGNMLKLKKQQRIRD